jgi:hypothetical protein
MFLKIHTDALTSLSHALHSALTGEHWFFLLPLSHLLATPMPATVEFGPPWLDTAARVGAPSLPRPTPPRRRPLPCRQLRPGHHRCHPSRRRALEDIVFAKQGVRQTMAPVVCYTSSILFLFSSLTFEIMFNRSFCLKYLFKYVIF